MRTIIKEICDEVIARYEQLLHKDGQAEDVATLRAAELEIEEIKQYVGERLMTTYGAVRSQQAVAQMKRCACGERLPVHRWTHWSYGTLHVDMTIADPYGYCRTCGESQRPLHGLFGMEPERWSLAVQRAAVDFGADHSFGKSEQKMAEHYPNTPIGQSSIRNLTLAHGAEAFTYIETKLQQAAAQGLEKPWLRDGVAYLEVEQDGSFIRTGVLQPIDWDEQAPGRTPKRQHESRRRHTEWKQVNLGAVHARGAVASLYCGRFGEGEAAFDDLFGLACLQGWSLNTHTTGIADGAPHIRKHLQARFRVARPAHVHITGPTESAFDFVLDRPHVRRHLVLAGEILAPTEQQPLATWVEGKLQQIDRGGVMQVMGYLTSAAQERENKTLQGQADYLYDNRDAVDYDRLKAAGYSISSGVVESAHGHVIQIRMKQPGMWWHPENVDAMVALRILRVNHWWEEYWQAQDTAYQKKAQALRQQHRAALAA